MSPISRSMLEKYLRGECSPEEEEHVRHWFDLNDADEYPSVMEDQEYLRKERKLWGRLSRNLRRDGISPPARMPLLRQMIPYAAAAVMLLVGAFLVWEHWGADRWWNGVTYCTSSGEIRRFSLPDGTEVLLNAMSEIRIPHDYGENDRRVYLEGEGYFLVRSDTLAFVVYSNDIATTALGTVFNVSAYPEDGETIVSLHEGRVSVNSALAPEDGTKESSLQMILQPGEEVICSGNGKFLKKVFDRRERLSWKDHVLYFDKADLTEVIQKLERYYGVRFNYQDLAGDRWKLTGEYHHVPLTDILESLSFNYGIKYTIKDDEITLFK